jgi:N-acetylglucosamine kinase-like BadF-type ATPase
MLFLLGIDGGGTRTTAWLADDRGRILARAVAGPSNPVKVGLAAVQRTLLQAARDCFRQARLKPRDLEAVCVGLGGVGRPVMQRRLLPWLRQALPARHHVLTTDAAITLRAALARSPGVVVISGTGSIAFAQNERGRPERAGGWGSAFDDAGSGYDLGRKAIAAALRAADGRGPHTQLTRKICQALGLNDISQVVSKPLSVPAIAALFPVVREAARRGDAVARRLCDEAGAELATLAVALLERWRWQKRIVPVVCAGGVLRSSLRIRRSFARHLRRHAPAARVLLLRRAPVEGALALAREALASHP